MITKILKKGKNSTISSLFAGIVIIMAMFMVVACEKDETSVADQQQTVRKPQPISDMEVMQYLPEVVDGRLVFKDFEAYEKYQQWIFDNQGSPEKIIKFNKSIGFVSMMEIYEQGLDELEKFEVVTSDFVKSNKNVFKEIELDGSIVQDLQAPPIVAYFANSNGVYQVEDEIMRVSYDYYYKIKNGDESLIQEIVAAKGDEIINSNIEIGSTKRANEKYGQYRYNTDYFSDKKRIVARLSTSYVAPFCHYWAETNSQQKIGVWIGKKLSGVWVSWPSGYWYETGQNTQYTISARTNGGESEQTIKSCFLFTHVDVDKSRSVCTPTHYGYDDSDYASWYNGNAFTGADDD
jgi:hypothetical protein